MPVNHLCAECYLQSYCRRLTARIVTRDELTPVFIADVRATMRSLGLSRDAWKPFLIDAYQDYAGRIVDTGGDEVMLDTGVYDLPSIRYWFRDLCRPIPSGVTPRLKRSAESRFIVTASILRAVYPARAALWGKKIANDRSEGALPAPVKMAGCPYPHFTTG